MKYVVLPDNFNHWQDVGGSSVSVDTEYSEKNVRNAELLSISIGTEDVTWIVRPPFSLLRMKSIQEYLLGRTELYTWNGVVDDFMLRRWGCELDVSKMVDGMLLEHLIDERLDHGLGDFAKREYQDDYKAQFWSKYETYQTATEEDQNEYEMRDGCYTFRAGIKYLGVLRDRMELVEHVHRLQWALFGTETAGVKIDVELLKSTYISMSEQISEYLPRLRSVFREYCDLYELKKWREELELRKTDRGKAGVRRPEFQWTSDKQLRWLVYDALQCPVIETTKKKQPKTDYETIKSLSANCPPLGVLAEYKQAKSVFSTFVEGMQDRLEGDRIYPHFSVNGTTTGRISHSNPNLGNLPTEGVIRNFFLPDPGYVFLGSDFSQLEVVIEANLTEDAQLLRIINEGVSKHDITAEGLSLSRERAKTLNFSLQYGAGVHKVSTILNCSRADAQDIYDKYWRLYSGVKTLKDSTCTTLAKYGRVTNLFGRTRHFEEPKNEFEKAKQERQAYNFLIQGVGADMCNRSMYLINDRLKELGIGRVVLSVHDEILTQVKVNAVDEAKGVIVSCMDESNDYLKFKYRVQNKLYGPLECWSKT